MSCCDQLIFFLGGTFKKPLTYLFRPHGIWYAAALNVIPVVMPCGAKKFLENYI
jgi:hypothetical protein